MPSLTLGAKSFHSYTPSRGSKLLLLKNKGGENESNSVGTGLSFTAVVGYPKENDSMHQSTGKGGRAPGTRGVDEEEGDKLPPGQLSLSFPKSPGY
jgi:hypothetical protein